MAGSSNIEWTDTTWNPVVGCAMVSPGCTHCYAETMSRRLAGMAVADLKKGKDPGRKANYLHVLNDRGRWNGSVMLVPEALPDPLGWRTPRKVFVNSMSDLFHVDVPFGYVDQVMAVMALTPWHTYQILTKRPERTAEYLCDGELGHRIYKQASAWLDEGAAGFLGRSWDRVHDQAGTDAHGGIYPWVRWRLPLPNVWLGTSVEDQQRADERIPHLLRCPAAVRFLSIEPLLGAIDLGNVRHQLDEESHEVFDALHHKDDLNKGQPSLGIDWVIVGGESGHDARPMHPDWARTLRDDCQAAGVPFFFKQWGQHVGARLRDGSLVAQNGKSYNLFQASTNFSEQDFAVGVGKEAAGRLLDGRTWDEMPLVTGN